MGLAEAAKALGLTEYALRKGARDGTFPYLLAGGRYWFDMDTLEQAIRTQMMGVVREYPEASVIAEQP